MMKFTPIYTLDINPDRYIPLGEDIEIAARAALKALGGVDTGHDVTFIGEEDAEWFGEEIVKALLPAVIGVGFGFENGEGAPPPLKKAVVSYPRSARIIGPPIGPVKVDEDFRALTVEFPCEVGVVGGWAEGRPFRLLIPLRKEHAWIRRP